jgi:fatty-acyl-CoA synthase
VKIVEGYPMTVTGKVQKFQLREDMKRLLNLSDQETA